MGGPRTGRRVTATIGSILASATLLVTACRSALPTGRVPTAGTYRLVVAERAAGQRRNALVHIPPGDRPDGSWPLVVALHGAFSSGRGMEKITGLSALADREGFVVIYPQGIGLLGLFRHFNAGFCCGKAQREELDDVGFVGRVVDAVAGRVGIDRQRIFVVGFSNGGMLAYRIAAMRPDLVRAFAVVGGTVGTTTLAEPPAIVAQVPEAPVPAMIFHGRADDVIPFEGGRAARTEAALASAVDSARWWAGRVGARAEEAVEDLRGGSVTRRSWRTPSGDDMVVLYTIAGWGHVWPGARQTRDLGGDDPLAGFDATELIWRFFSRYGDDASGP